uniref:CSD domain-containing protein n=1 Tax=Lotharella oceanica TaxID=641309 RepID=A0A7S2X8I2_9EUKA|mmetsp:Transcript_19616/g.36926  ORF Transcript_19616/g.36926 Transcript_19616/m.36926 type:complete len:262 (+) Transcript_19616:142-927(+)|eukprot:CAMPEP_0170167312 /NCGR_PEP_ID=MMETSP0040_2-20121228/757_1 /TAXON_ID=641309 /ORGANISM="Lotharella oceanica, Strain CCMP622" /LENGTH=261 /DNA_ID=CAMNT_0010405297 /DNA_START=142 /DNA_END=927 /DNA_ORIENTATION=+
MDVGLQIKVDLMVSELKCSASLATNVLKAHGGSIDKAKEWISDPKNKSRVDAMNRLATYGPSLTQKLTAVTKPASTSASTSAAAEKTNASSSSTSNAADAKVRLKGSCVKYNKKKGYGFIKPKGGGKDVFVHQASIKAKGFRSLAVGEEVEFEVVQKDGRTEAVKVTGPGGKDVKGAPRDEKSEDNGVVVASEALERKTLPSLIGKATMFMPRGVKKTPAKGGWVRPGAKKKKKQAAAAAALSSTAPPPAKKHKSGGSRWG